MIYDRHVFLFPIAAREMSRTKRTDVHCLRRSHENCSPREQKWFVQFAEMVLRVPLREMLFADDLHWLLT